LQHDGLHSQIVCRQRSALAEAGVTITLWKVPSQMPV